MRCRIVAALTALSFVLSGCGKSGTTEAEPTKPAGDSWVNVQPGNPTPSAPGPGYGSQMPALPPVSFLPTTDACTVPWEIEQGSVLIPMVVTPGKGSFTVTWPNRYGDTYRLTAVPQDLVSGEQPEPAWQTVKTGAECEVTATIGGLTSGRAYIVWLDAPNTPRKVDGSRSLYSGKSKVLIPN